MATERIQRRIDRLLDQVEEAADQEDWEAVQRLSRQVLTLDPDNAGRGPTSHVRRREHVGRRITRLDS